jgi:hypothetical protein
VSIKFLRNDFGKVEFEKFILCDAILVKLSALLGSEERLLFSQRDRSFYWKRRCEDGPHF